MKLTDIKAALELIDYTSLTQKQAGELIGTTQSDVSRCCRHYGIQWPYKKREQRGENNHNFKDGMGRSTIERTTRVIIIHSRRSLFVCERCGCENKDGSEHPRHHKDRDRSNNTSNNIEVLCMSCHRIEHNKETERDIETGRFVR